MKLITSNLRLTSWKGGLH